MKTTLCKAFAAILAVSLFIGALPSARAAAATYTGYTSLDPSQPITFDGKTVTWNGKTFALDANTVFLDYRLKSEQLAGNPYAFNNLKDAAAALKSGTPEKPMMLLVAPGVYWVDDPDDPVIRGTNGTSVTGMTITCDNLYFYGLNTNRANVVFAVNRGQTQGSNGNFTMFSIQGYGLKSENVTFGNYCNVDLKFPLNPSMSRPKRADAITQAQLFNYSGRGDGVAINTGFISRLNLLPFASAYINCHIESSGHSGGNGVFIGCTLEFYNFNFATAKFFDCDITITPIPSAMEGRPIFKFGFEDGAGNGGVLIDTRFHRSQEMIDKKVAAEISWGRVPQSPTIRGYQYNVTLDGKPYVVQEASTPGATVVIPDGSDLLKAFKVVYNGKTYYNIPNVDNGYDPLDAIPAIQAAAVAAGKDKDYYLTIPTSATLQVAQGSAATIRSGQSTAALVSNALPAYDTSSSALGQWQYTASSPSMVQITPGPNNTVTVAGTNKTTAPVEVLITGKNALGIEACTRLTVQPAFVDPPKFTKAPVITKTADGHVKLDYQLDLGTGADQSVINWYRCKDAQGVNGMAVAVSRLGKPEISYIVSDGDVGSYLVATIEPKSSLSEAGSMQTVYSPAVVAKDDVKIHAIDTNMQNFPSDAQPAIIPGTWTVDTWAYGQGQSGSINYHGLYETARPSSLFYTPAAGKYGDMAVQAKVAPDKNTGQGFGSATDQYMDFYIKYDTTTNSGYGLRIQRLNPDEIKAIGFDNGGAVAGCAVFLIQMKDGTATPISKKVMTSSFVAECTVDMAIKNGKLSGSVSSSEPTRSGDAFKYPREVQLEATITPNDFGGTGTYFTGTVGVNAVLVTSWKTSWSP